MQDNKKYIIEIEGKDGQMVKDAAWWERNKDSVFERAPKALVYEVADYDENDSRETDQYLLGMEGYGDMDLWDSARWERNKDQLATQFPNAVVKRVRYIDYWGDQKSAIETRQTEIEDRLKALRDEDSHYLHAPVQDAPVSSELTAPVSEPVYRSTPATRPQKKDLALLDQQKRLMETNPEYASLWQEKNAIAEKYEQNPYVIAQREAEAEYEANYLDYLENDVRENMGKAGLESPEREQFAFRPSAPFLGAAAQQASMFHTGDFEKDPHKAQYYADALNYIEAAKGLKEEKEGFGQASYDVAKSMYLQPLAKEAATAVEIWKMLDRLEEKYGDLNDIDGEKIEETLTDEEKSLLLSYFAYNSALQDAEHSKSVAYKAGEIFGRSIPFMLEFVLTGGVSKLGAELTKKASKGFINWILRKTGKVARSQGTKWMLNTLGKGATRLLTNIVPTMVGETFRTVAQPTTYFEMLKSLPQYGEDGHLHVGKNMAVSFADRVIENFSEASGELLLGAFGKAKGNTPYGKTRQFLSNLGFQGLPAEIFEEIEGAALRELTGVDTKAFEHMFDTDNFAAMVIGFAPMTMIGATTAGVGMTAATLEMNSAAKRIQKELAGNYSQAQIDHALKAIRQTNTPNEAVKTMKALLSGAEWGNATGAQVKALWDYGKAVATYKSMFSEKQEMDRAMRDAKAAEMEQQYGKYWQEQTDAEGNAVAGSQKVSVAILNDGRKVFMLETPNEQGEFAIKDRKTGEVGFAKESDIKTYEVDGENVKLQEDFDSIDNFVDAQIMSERKSDESVRMEKEKAANIEALKAEIKANNDAVVLGTEGDHRVVYVKEYTDDGVVAYDEAGNRVDLTWQDVSNVFNMGQVEGKSDEQLMREEIDRIVNERGGKKPVEKTEIPRREDGSIDEDAFWNQSPEAWAEWNDKQNNDNGADTYDQILSEKASLEAQLKEVQKQKTSAPFKRREANRAAKQIADRLARLTAMEEQYAERFKTPEQKRADMIAKAKEIAKRWQEKWGITINIIEDKADITYKEVKERLDVSEDGTFAWTDLGNKVAEIYMPNITSVEQFKEKVAHEVVSHIGLRALLGEKYNSFLERVWGAMSESSQKVFYNYAAASKYKGLDRIHYAADEYVAHIAERMGVEALTAEEQTFWQKLLQFLKDLFSGDLFKGITENEIINNLKKSYQNLESGQSANADTGKGLRNSMRASSEYEALAAELTPEEIAAVASNDLQVATQAYETLLASAPKVEQGESAKDFIARKKAYNEQVAEAKAALDARQALMDEIARIDAANAPVLTDTKVLEQGMMFSVKLTDSEIDNLVEAMKANAEVAEVIALTPENWEAQFGAEGIIETPVGEVKMGPNQVTKLFSRNREEYFGMIKPTLTRPDVVVEKFAPAEDAERDTKYVFIKSFVKPDGSRIIHFESVTVQKEGREVSVSSHEAKEKDIKKEMQNGKLLHLNGMLSLSSEGSLTEAPIQERPDLVPTSNNVTSGSKDSENLETPSESERFSVSAVRIDPDANQQAEDNVMFSTRRGSLVGMHNISEEKLRKLIKQGGSANPSTAVIDIERQSFDSYGDISLIMPSSLVDTETGRNAGTFTADAWTPTYPQIEKRFSDDNLQRAYWRDITAIPEEMQHEVRMAFDSWLDNRTASGLAYMFLLERGEAPEMVRVAAKYPQEIKDEMSAILGEGRTGFYELTDEEKQAVLDLYIQENFGGSREDFDRSIAETIQRIEDRLSTGKVPSFVEKRITADLQWMKEHGYNYDNISNFVRDIVSDIRHAGEVNDAATTNRALDYIKDNNLSAEYEQWKESLNDRYGIKEYLFGGYTPSGNPRWLPNTVENASKLMNKQGLAGATGMASSFNRFVATLAPKKKSLSDISTSKDLLVEDEKLVDDFRDKWSEVFFDLGIKCQPEAKGYEDYGLERLTEAAQKKNPGAYLKKEYGVELSQEDLQRLADMIKAIKTEFPARYFETKFQRPVYLNEFTAAVMPTTTSADIKQAIAEAGLPIFEYDSTIDGARREATLKATDIEGVRFSVTFNSANEELNNTGLSMDNPVLMQEYGLSAIELSKKGNYVTLSKIVAAEQGQGNGTRFMGDLTKNADANGWILALTPDTTYGDTSVARLKKFYKRFGFKDNKGRNADFNTRESMVRVPQQQGDLRFSFIGERGAENLDKFEESTIRLDNLSVAREMEQQMNPDWNAKNDESALKIKMATGWERGADGKWRYELPDAKLNSRWERASILANAIVDDALFAAYPELKFYPVYIENGRGGDSYFDYNTNKIKIVGNDEKEIIRSLSHEIQHAIQKLEGFARGGNPYSAKQALDNLWFGKYEEIYRNSLRKKIDYALMDQEDIWDMCNRLQSLQGKTDARSRAKVSDLKESIAVRVEAVQKDVAWEGHEKIVGERNLGPAGVANLKNWLSEYRNYLLGLDENTEFTKEEQKAFDIKSMREDAVEAYYRLAGEVEARNVVDRYDRPKESLASLTEDVSREDLIFLEEVLGKKPKDPTTPKRGKKGSDIRFSTAPSSIDIEAVKGLQLFESMGYDLEGQMKLAEDSVAAALARIKYWSNSKKAGAEQGRAGAQHAFDVAKRQMELLRDVQSQLIDVTYMEPAPREGDEPQNIREYIAQMLTGKNGSRLTPETLENELGWSAADRAGMKYIVSSKGMSVNELAELIMADAPAHVLRGMESDDVRNEILDFLQSVRTYTEIRDYMANARMAEAKAEADQHNADIDRFKEEFEAREGMTVEQYNEMVIQQMKEARDAWLASAENPAAFTPEEEKDVTDVPSDEELEGMTVEQIVNSGKQKMLEAAAEAKDSFMERVFKINARLDKVRAALAAQREYDQTTAALIADMANEMLENGALSKVTRAEIKRIVSAVKNAVGKQDIAPYVDRIMDVMIGNQIRNAKNRLKEFLKIKGKKVNSSGVEVQGKLDIEGQGVLAAMKKGMAYDMAKLESEIAEAEDRLFDSSQVISRDAANELAGLYMAQEYMENIKASEAEEVSLRDELDKAQKERRAGRMSREAYREYEKSVVDAVRENRMQRVTAYENLLDNMAERVMSSIAKANALREADKARVERIHHFANSDMEGMPADELKQTPKGEAFWNNNIVQFFLSPLATFDQMLRHFAPKSRDGKGYLWNHFMGGWMKAAENEYTGVRDAHSVLDEKARQVFGKDVKRWSDIFSIVKRLPNMKFEVFDAGKMKEYEFTQGNLMYIYMVNKMSDGKMKLRRMGITEEQVEQIAREMDPRLVELADWLQDSFLPSLREKYNTVHERMFGAPMAAIENYFPLVVNQNARAREEDVNNPQGTAKPSTITGAIIKRTKNSAALDLLNADALDVVLGHIEDMEHWAAFAEWNRDLNTLLSYKKFRNRLQNASGIYGAGKELWKNFRTAAEIAAGVYQPAGKGVHDKLALNLVKGVTGAKIAFRVYTALKQFLSMPAFVSDSRADILMKNMANPMGARNWAMENLPLFEKRWKSRQAGDSRLMATESDWKVWKTKAVEIAGRVGMTPNAFVDAVTVSIGARSIYETKYRQYLDYGYSEEQADAKAKQDATVLFNESQQSNEAAFLSQMQVDRTMESTLFTVFRNSAMGYQRMYVDALRNLGRMMKKGYKEESIEYMKKQMMRDGLTEEQAQRAAEKIYRRSFTKNATQAFTFGFLVQFAWNLGPVAVYLLMGDDDDEKWAMLKDAAVRGLVGGPVEGLAAGQLASSLIGNAAMGEKLSEVGGIQLPAVSDLETLKTLWDTERYRGLNDLFNIVVQSGIGVNPQTFTDVITAVVDACNGDLETSKEVMFAVLRILQVPQSQIDKLYLEEMDITADEAYDMTVQEFAERYAKYKMMRNAPLTKGLYPEEDAKAREEKYIKRFLQDMRERRKTHGSEEAQLWLEYIDTEFKEMGETLRDLKRRKEETDAASDERDEVNAELSALKKTEAYDKYKAAKKVAEKYEAYKENPTDIKKELLIGRWNELMDMFNAPELKRQQE